MNRPLSLVLSVTALMLSACQTGADPEARTVETVRTKPVASALLKDVGALKPSPLHPGTWYELSASLKSYTSIIIEEPIVQPDAFGTAGPDDENTPDTIATRLRDELTNAMSQEYKIVDSPGAKTARLRVLLKRVDRSRDRVSGARVMGGAAADVEIADATTGVRLMAATEDDKAADTHAMTSADPYHDAKATFVHWSARLLRSIRSADEYATRP